MGSLEGTHVHSDKSTSECLDTIRFVSQGDTGSGVSFRAMMYVPSAVPDDFWQKITAGVKNIRLMVKVGNDI
jgi:hypothetical protein